MEHVARTVRRVPEVMVKVSGGGTSTKAVVAHFKYLNRRREFEIETDDGEHLRGRGLVKNQVENWDLEFDAAEWQSAYRGTPTEAVARKLLNGDQTNRAWQLRSEQCPCPLLPNIAR